ncbi:hypothetical protein Tco_1049344, partial [Tanacetum coccineum]
MQMVGGKGGNHFRQYARQNVRNLNGYNVVQNARNQVVQNVVQNLGVQNVGNKNRFIVIPGIANQNVNQNRNGDLDEIKEVNANCILMAYSAASIDIGGAFLVWNKVGGTVQQNPTTVEETRAYFESLYNNLAIEVKKVNTVNHKMKETNANLTSLEYEIERLLKAVVSQHIMSTVQSNSIVDTSNLQYKKCEECKYDKISYDKAYNDMQQKIERVQAQLGDFKGKSQDTSCVSDAFDPLSQKLEDKNVSLGFPVLNYAKENEHLKTTYKNLFDYIKVTRAQTKLIA